MTWDRARPWLGAVVRLFLGAVWIWASLSKLSDPRTFVQAVRAYDVTPEWLSKAIGYGLPVLELCVGIVLVVGILTRIAAAVSGVLFLVFLIGLVQAAARGIQLECGCFGGGGLTQSGSTNYTWDILRDLGLLLLAAFLVVWPMTRFSVDEYLTRHDQVERPSAKRMRIDKARRKYEAQLESRRRQAQVRNRWLVASISTVVVLISVVGIGVQSDRAKIQGSLVAKNATLDHGVVYGKKAAATVDVYEDPQCPVCEAFEQQVGPTLKKLVDANKAQARYHVIAILDPSSNGNRYSSRAANALYCASDISDDAFYALHQVIYGTYKGQKVQPAENGNGRTNTQLINYGRGAGFTGKKLTNYSTCVTNEKHKAFVAAITDRASRNRVNATPTVLVNGHKVTATKQALTAAVTKALKNGPAPSPSPSTSSASASKSGSATATPTRTASRSG